MRTHHLTMDQQSVSIDVGDDVQMELEELPGAAFEWHLLPCRNLVLVEDECLPAHSLAPGAGARRRFRLRAERAGADEIGLDLVRPWQSTEVASSLRVQVTVSRHHR